MNDNENTAQDAPEKCDRCGGEPKNHTPVEGDCLLPHGYTHNQHPPQASVGWICRGCVDRQRDWLKEIVELYGTLTDVLLAGSIPDDTAEHKHQRKAPASPSPLRLDAWALLHGQLNDHIRDRDGTDHPAYLGANLPDILAILTGWAQAAYDARQWTATAPDTVAGAAAALITHADVMAGIPDVDTYDTELAWVRRALRNAHGLAHPTALGHCLSVDCVGTVRPVPGGAPKCSRCKRVYGTLDLVRLRANEAAS